MRHQLVADPGGAGGPREKAERFAELQAARAEQLAARISELLTLRGDERALDVGAGTGAFAFAIAPQVREVVALDSDRSDGRARARRRARQCRVRRRRRGAPRPSARSSSTSSARCARCTTRAGPELVVAEIARVARLGATVLVVDQLAPVDPLAAFELNRFERARDPSTTRLLADSDLRGLFDMNGLVLRRGEIDQEQRDLDDYLDLAGCAGGDRERARSMAPKGYRADLGWYVLTRA